MIPNAITLDDQPTDSYCLRGVTGRDWLAWRILPLLGLGWLGRRYIFKRVVRGLGITPARLANKPFVVEFPDGFRYQLLDCNGRAREV